MALLDMAGMKLWFCSCRGSYGHFHFIVFAKPKFQCYICVIDKISSKTAIEMGSCDLEGRESMLFRLEIENFYSIRERQVLDLRVSEKAPAKPERFVPIYPGATERVPKVMVTFGANGAGKTNSLRSVVFLAWFVSDSFRQPPEGTIPLAPFYNRDSLGHPTRLAVSLGGPTNLSDPDDPSTTFGTYDYELVILHGQQSNRVARESLRHRIHGARRSVRVFERNESGEVLAGETFSLTRYGPVIDKIRPNASVISTLAQFEHRPSIALREFARLVATNLFITKTDYTDDQVLTTLGANPSILEALNREIPRADLGVQSLQIQHNGGRPAVVFSHAGLDFAVPLHLESHGTQSFVRSFPIIASALDSGALAVIDEFDASLHPHMLVEIVRWFHDPQRNPNDARLWVTCQNASLLEELEKEEIIFCEKDSLGRTILYGLQDIKNVRRVDNYYRKYLSGVYGALPAFG